MFFVDGHVYMSASRKEMYGRISLSVVLVQALWSLVGRDKGGLPKMIEICSCIGRKSQKGFPALESSVRSVLIGGDTRCLEKVHSRMAWVSHPSVLLVHRVHRRSP